MADSASNNWLAGRLDSLRSILASATGVIVALGALIGAIIGLVHLWPTGRAAPTADKCKSPYVWREATPDDHVCVTKAPHEQTLEDNNIALSRRNPRGGPYGADTCLVGFVWRDIFEGDHVCVTPATRDQVVEDNREGPNRIER